MYMVTSGKHWNSGCCFDYGNSETDRKADGAGTMDTVNLSGMGEWANGAGSGPWVKADLEYGVFTDNVNNSHQNLNNPSQTSTYVTAILKNNGTTEFALRGGDAATGPLGTYFKGSLPGRLQSHEEAGRDCPRERRRLLQTGGRRQREHRHVLRGLHRHGLPDGRHRGRRSGQHRRRRVRQVAGTIARVRARHRWVP